MQVKENNFGYALGEMEREAEVAKHEKQKTEAKDKWHAKGIDFLYCNYSQLNFENNILQAI